MHMEVSLLDINVIWSTQKRERERERCEWTLEYFPEEASPAFLDCIIFSSQPYIQCKEVLNGKGHWLWLDNTSIYEQQFAFIIYTAFCFVNSRDWNI